MRIKAIILTLVFLLGGSGLSIDIAQCCDSFAGISLSFAHPAHEDGKECCACIKAVKKSSCCDDINVQTVINPVLGLGKSSKSLVSHFDFKVFRFVERNIAVLPDAVQYQISHRDLHLNDPVPVLIKKRVLQI